MLIIAGEIMRSSIAAVLLIVVAIVAFAAGFYTQPVVVGPSPAPTPTPTPTPAPTTWEIVQQRGKIIVGSSPDWPPFEFLDPDTGEFAGFEVELMNMIAERLGLTVEWKAMDFDTIIPEVQAKTIDMGVSGFSVKPERMEIVRFTMHHSITEGQVIMLESRAKELGITELDSLEQLGEYGLICGAQSATTQEDEILKLEQAGKVPKGTVKSYEDYLLALEDMKRGTIDCIYAETPVTSWWILEAEQAGEEPLVVIFRRPYWPVAFIANLESDTLVTKVNGALAELIAEGKVAELKAKWKCD